MIDDGWRPDQRLSMRKKIVAIIEHYAVDGVAHIGPSNISRLVGVARESSAEMLTKMESSGELVKIAEGTARVAPKWRVGIPREAVIRPEFNAEMDETVRAMWTTGKSDGQIARWLHVPIDTVRNRRVRLNLRMDSKRVRIASPQSRSVLETMQAPVRHRIPAEPIDLDAALTWARRNGVPDHENGDPPGIETINARRRAYFLTPWFIRRRTSPMGLLPHPGETKVFMPEEVNGRLAPRLPPGAETPPEARFWAGVAKGGEDECWPFTNSGTLHVKGQKLTMRWYSWVLHYGPVPSAGKKGGWTTATCGRRDCVNPRHLRVIVHTDRFAEAAD